MCERCADVNATTVLAGCRTADHLFRPADRTQGKQDGRLVAYLEGCDDCGVGPLEEHMDSCPYVQELERKRADDVRDHLERSDIRENVDFDFDVADQFRRQRGQIG